MADNRRVLRVARELQHLLSQLFVSGLKIPLPGLVTVVQVDVSPDLRSARVYIKSNGPISETEEVLTLLEEQRRDIQHHINRELKLKFSPVLKFVVGGGKEGPLDEVDQLLANLHRVRD